MENNLIKYIVYCTVCTINNKIYIGVHKTNPEIFDYYLGDGAYANRPSTYERSKTKFHYALKKYGVKNFIRNTIAIFDNEQDAYDLEEELVNKEFLKRSDVYNISLGGNHANIPELAYTTYQYDEFGNFIKEYYSIKEASIGVNRSFRSIWRAIKEKCKCANYFWTNIKYEKLDLSKMKSYEGLNKIPVFQYNIEGTYECCYESIRDASRILNIHSSNLSSAIKLGTICSNKYFTSIYSPNYSIAKDNIIKSRPVYQYDLNGTFIAEYKYQQEAKNILKIKGDIYKAIKLGRQCGGFQWSFEKLDSMPPVKTKAGKARRVGKYDKNWNFIEEYKSLAECKRINGSGMIHVITGRDEFAKGYRYKYLD